VMDVKGGCFKHDFIAKGDALLVGVCAWHKMTSVRFSVQFCKKLQFSDWFCKINCGVGLLSYVHDVLLCGIGPTVSRMIQNYKCRDMA